MSKLVLIGFVLLFAVGNAPFILSNDEASVVDTRIDIRKCHISVKNNTRYYWYEYTAREFNYIINPAVIQFIVVSGGDRMAHAVTSDPIQHPKRDTIVAFGSYSVITEQTKVTCVANKPDQRS